MAFSPKQRAAIFEKLKQSPKMQQPLKPPSAPQTMKPLSAPKPPKQMSSFNDIPQQAGIKNQVNPNFIGNGRPQRFMKLKKMSGF